MQLFCPGNFFREEGFSLCADTGRSCPAENFMMEAAYARVLEAAAANPETEKGSLLICSKHARVFLRLVCDGCS